MSKLINKVAIVTASTEGIGFAIAKRLCEDGAKVMISSRKSKNVQSALAKLDTFVKDGHCSGCDCHVGKKEDRVGLIKRTTQAFGGIDILVSNAAVSPFFGPLLETPEDAFNKLLDINIKSAFMLVKEAYPYMNKNSSIVFVSSIGGFHPLPLIGGYSMTKTALLGLTKALAAELGPGGTRVNCIAPGVIRTKLSESLTSGELSEKILEQTPLGRFGEVDDCASVVSFLCSDDARYVTGETIVVSGGMPSRL